MKFFRQGSSVRIRRFLRPGILAIMVAISDEVSEPAQSQPAMGVSAIQSNGWLRVAGQIGSNALVRLEASPDLIRWEEIAVLHGDRFEFSDPVSARMPHRFYRFSTAELTTTNDWKNQISGPLPLPRDEFTGTTDFIKFAILTNDPARVYYADGRRYVFHYEFATRRLPPLVGLDTTEFERISLYNEGRGVILGTVIFPGDEFTRFWEYGIQFISRDPLPREVVRNLFELVRSTVVTDPRVRAFYVPTYEQAAAAETDRDWLESQGILVGSTARWVNGQACYSMGWAIGTLKYFSATNVAAAYADGRLGPQDILLTDGVPAELPYVAGIITLSPSTPNSHVAILARSYGVPFVHPTDENLRARALELVGREVVLELSDALRRCDATLIGLEEGFDPALKAEITGLKSIPPLRLASIASYGAYTAPTDNLTPADIRFFGGKAANYGLLRRTIPSNAPPAIAISFDLWMEFMAQALPNGKTLWQEITNRLSGYSFPADVPVIKTNLAAIRALIRQATRFTTNQEETIISALRVFDSRKNIRFRSSTNVEDTEAFTGAGLYDSYSGCLDDDLDGDTAGPSHCDATEEDERGVFRAIRRVYASFYNDNAYLERLRHSVNENTVGMAVLVHNSTPDDIEMANGVGVVQAGVSGTKWFKGDLVTQHGAVSVANPDGHAVPEIIRATRFSDGSTMAVELDQGSSLLPRGAYVLEWPSDYTALSEMLFSVSSAYRQMMAREEEFLLDFEYKKVRPGRLEVKQVREIPAPRNTNNSSHYLINNPRILVPLHSFNGNDIDLFAAHRLKSRWTIRTRNLRVDESHLNSTIFTELSIEHVNGDRIETLAGPIQNFRNYSNTVSFLYGRWNVRDFWHMSSVGGPATMELTAYLDPGQRLFTRPSLSLTAHYDQPVPHTMGSTGATMRTSESILLTEQRNVETMAQDYLVNRSYAFNGGGTNVIITPVYRRGADSASGDTRRLIGTMQTRIEGITSQPILLTNFYSQTISFGHGYFGTEFLFEPRLEQSIPQRILDELEALDIRLFHLAVNASRSLHSIGRDGTWRRVGSPASQ